MATEINVRGVIPNDMAVRLRNVIAFCSKAISRGPCNLFRRLSIADSDEVTRYDSTRGDKFLFALGSRENLSFVKFTKTACT